MHEVDACSDGHGFSDAFEVIGFQAIEGFLFVDEGFDMRLVDGS